VAGAVGVREIRWCRCWVHRYDRASHPASLAVTVMMWRAEHEVAWAASRSVTTGELLKLR